MGLVQDEEEALQQYLRKVEIFLSHSKHDDHGEPIANLIREHLFKGVGGTLATFFDVHEIAAGVPFDKVLLHKLRVSAVVVGLPTERPLGEAGRKSGVTETAALRTDSPPV